MFSNPPEMLEPVNYNHCLMQSALLPGVKLPRSVLTGEDIVKAVTLDRHLNVSDLGFVQSEPSWGSGAVRELRRNG